MALDAVVVGAGPNGLTAAAILARAGLSVRLFEARATIGGGCRTDELTLPGYLHDVCSAIHPLAAASRAFAALPLAAHGLEWIESELALAHPLDDGTAVVLERSVERTAAGLGPDAAAYRRLLAPLVASWPRLEADVLGPLSRFPRHPLAAARFGSWAVRPARALAESLFRGRRARALFAGLAAHSVLPLTAPASAGVGLVLALLAHRVGWPLPRGGSQRIAAALAGCLEDAGGEVRTASPVVSLNELPPHRVALCDVVPRRLVALAGERMPRRYRRRLEGFRHGPGVCKMDYALAAPVPWTAAACRRAATVHLGGTLEEIAAAEAAVWRGAHAERPFVLLAQPSLFDPTRAPAGGHTAWAYCHVPAGSERDASAEIEAQIERFAPGFGERVVARSLRTAAELAAENPNCPGGDITGGVPDLAQLLARPTWGRDPYATPAPGLYLCSASTPPGGGVHGLCGARAAASALAALGIEPPLAL